MSPVPASGRLARSENHRLDTTGGARGDQVYGRNREAWMRFDMNGSEAPTTLISRGQTFAAREKLFAESGSGGER